MMQGRGLVGTRPQAGGDDVDDLPDDSSDDSSAHGFKPSPLFHQPQLRWTIIGISCIVISVAIAIAFDAKPTSILIATVASAFLVGTILCLVQINRWEQAGLFYDDQHAESAKWSSRWRALHAQSQQTVTVLSHLTDGVIMLSADTQILLINSSARRLLALSPDHVLLGRRLAEIVRVPEITHAVQQSLKNATVGRKSQTRELTDSINQIEIIDGATVRPISVRINRISDSSDSNLILLIRDETDAQRVEAIRREFIANVSHELKTPLAAIKGYAETAELAIEDDPQAASHFVRQIGGQCLRLEKLVADMMQLARAQSSRENLDIVPISLEQVVEKSMTSFHPIAEAKGVALSFLRDETSGDHEHLKVLSDAEATLTISNNLISNAIRHTPSGGHVQIRVERRDNHVALVVSDDGEGIQAKELDRIFERFYRVTKARQPKDGGSGVGLSIVKNLARALNGQVNVKSSPGKGSTFEVLLPAVLSD
ncbi:sensor histidine kinase [Stieleria varia]|uniref:histidine kinase n=1 Tax=Stieleria varia TaxID=2528005 RepID=A0A5C6AGX9_9BACT|nr:ATP-binding protein [Stieleria varia]TWT98435.1 Alkaline phosphatase synthesis sensor protein PhoR [Stieleria varia]